MTKNEIIAQVKANGTPKKVEVFGWKHEYKLVTEHVPAVALAFQRATGN